MMTRKRTGEPIVRSCIVTLALVCASACGTETEIPRASEDVITKDTRVSGAAVIEGTPGGTECPAGMALASGNYCPEVEHTCLKWLDPPGSPYAQFRCAKYQAPAKCKGPKRAMHYCIDIKERREPDSQLPAHFVSFNAAAKACAADGARICKESEWEFACEGEEMRPYPYGFSRVSSTCNIDRTGLGGPNGKLRDLRAPNDAYPKCLSPFGVHNMTGNADEWVERDGPHRSVLRGGWWLPGRNRCRAATAEHGEGYADSQVGFRCCSDG